MNLTGIIIGAISFLSIGMSSWWSILELFEQEKRVQKGWFPANPARKKK